MDHRYAQGDATHPQIPGDQGEQPLGNQTHPKHREDHAQLAGGEQSDAGDGHRSCRV